MEYSENVNWRRKI